MPRTFTTAMTLALFACCVACSSSSGGGSDASTVDVIAPPEEDATVADASEEEAESSPVYGCDEAQLAFAAGMACGQCVAQNCAAFLKACTNCINCEMQLGMGCSMCSGTCFARGTVAPALDAGP